ncbi:MAG: hypothetical protein ACR2GC_10120 [Methyloceanibacter sp.]|uniref:hypothetical protein n=1 Tax=Methyloceanibacter sp. TaxID=1965321 RepID=UPI003D9B46EE
MSPRHLTYVECCDDPNIFGPWFTGESWANWRVIDKAIFGQPFADGEARIFEQLTGRTDSPTEPASEAWLAFGRRAGKDVKAASYTCYLATIGADAYGYRQHLVRGEKGVVQVLAVDRDQAQVCLGYAKAMFEQPMLAAMVKRMTADSIELNNQISIEITTNDRRRVRGRTVIAAVLDEVAHWRSDNTANPDEDVFQALVPAMATIPNALLIGISSPYSRKGLLWRKHDANYGRPGRVLVARAPTWVMNPTLPRDSAFIAEQYAKDPAWARGEYGAEWRDDIESFVSLDVVRACVQVGVRERSFQAKHIYHAFVDVAAGSGADAYAMAVAHKEGDRVLIDATREVKPPFSPNDVTAEFARLAKSYRVRWAYGDKYAGDWVTEAWRAHDVGFRHSEWTKSQLYGDLLPLLNATQIMLLDDERVVNQIAGLERRQKFGGRAGSIDHPERGHDDIANVVAGAAVHAWHSRRTVGTGVPGLDDAWWRAEPKVVLGYAGAKAKGHSAYRGTAGRRSATAAELCTLKIEKTFVGPLGHWVEKHGGVAGDGRQKYAVMSPEGSILAFAWGEDDARQKALDISGSRKVSA